MCIIWSSDWQSYKKISKRHDFARAFCFHFLIINNQ